MPAGGKKPFLKLDFKNLRDTVFTLSDYYIEVDIPRQLGRLISRQEDTLTFKVSTGSDKVEKGVITNEGLFVIQWKHPRINSIQFDSTLLIKWMGFNYGIGFHALLGYSYYRYLGVKNVSHGCVRITREDADYLYERVKLGTPVLVHNGNSALRIVFADSAGQYRKYEYWELKQIFRDRFNALYNKRYYIEVTEKLLVDNFNVTHDGLPIGNSALIPEKQYISPFNENKAVTALDNLRIKTSASPKADSLLSEFQLQP